MQRALTIAMAIIIALFIAAVIVIYSSIDTVIADTISKRGADIIQTEVTTGDIQYSTDSGHTVIRDLKIKNPAGFSPVPAMNFPELQYWLIPESLGSEVLHVANLVLRAPEITFEIRDSGDNLRTLRQQVAYSLEHPKPLAGEKKIYVQRLLIEKATVVIEAKEMAGAKKTVLLKDIQIDNLGTEQEGLSAEELVHTILLLLTREATLATLESDLPLSAKARTMLDGAIDETGFTLKQIRRLLDF